MAIDTTKVGVPVGVGLIDFGASVMDSRSGKTGWKSAQSMTRVGLTAVAYLLQLYGPSQYRAHAETAAIAYTPLLTKTLAAYIAPRIGIKDEISDDVYGGFRPRKIVLPPGTPGSVAGLDPSRLSPQQQTVQARVIREIG